MIRLSMIAIILGTRPEITKMFPIIRACEVLSEDYLMLHTDQHYSSYSMDWAFVEDLEIPQLEYNLNVSSGTHIEQTGKIMTGIEKVLQEKKPRIVFVQGDTSKVFADALTASKLHIKAGHVEAGLRSFDRQMSEEIKRIVLNHISDMPYPPTETAKKNLIGEGIHEEKIFVTGNTVVDAVKQNLAIAQRKGDLLQQLGLTTSKGFFLVIVHRVENVDNKGRLERLLQCLKRLLRIILYDYHIFDVPTDSKDDTGFRPLPEWSLHNKPLAT